MLSAQWRETDWNLCQVPSCVMKILFKFALCMKKNFNWVNVNILKKCKDACVTGSFPTSVVLRVEFVHDLSACGIINYTVGPNTYWKTLYEEPASLPLDQLKNFEQALK
jgi:hypothetical protein